MLFLIFGISNIIAAQNDCFLSWDSGVPSVDSPYCEEPNGSIVVSASGSGNVTYQLNGGSAQENGLFENLTTGTYTIVATDEMGCQISLVVFLEGQESISVSSIDVTPSACDDSTGSITINASGLGLRYSLGNSEYQISNTFSGLGGGTYSVRIRDVNQCIEIRQVTVAQGSIVVNNIVVLPTTCIDNTGEIIVDADGDGISYRLDGVTGWQSGNSFSNLAPGVYWLEIRDSQGCVVRRRCVIGNSLDYDVDVRNPLCGEEFGSIRFDVNTPGNYEFSIDGGATYQSQDFYDNLPIGPYNLFIRLVGSDCQVNRRVSITEQPDIQINVIDIVQPTCGGANGAMDITTTGDVAEFQLVSEALTVTNNIGHFSDLPAGDYLISALSEAGCLITRSVSLEEVNDIVVNNVSAAASSCIVPEGAISIDAFSSADVTLQFRINGGEYGNSPEFQNLHAGPHTISILSETGCQMEFPVTVPPKDPIIIQEIITTVPSSVCTTDGVIELIVEGLDLEYSVDQVNWQTSNIFSGLTTDVYVVYIRSLATNCTTQTGEIELLGGFYIEALDVVNTFCENPEGEVSIYAVGHGLEYRVDDGAYQESPDFNNLSVGWHTAHVRDVYDCVLEQDFEITSLGNVAFTGYEIFFPDCNENNAAVELFVDSESPNLEYWQEGGQPSSENIFYSLPKGTEKFYVRDEYGCTAEIEIEIFETSKIENIASVEDYICFNQDGSISMSHVGGLSPFRYSLDGITYQSSNVISGLSEGEYTVHVLDRVGCPSSLLVEVGYQCEAMLPSAITPDGNGINECLVLLHERNLKVNEFRVFNSWGELVFEKYDFWSSDYSNYWTGKDFLGEDGDQKVFLYEVSYINYDGAEKVKSGAVHLVR